MTDVDEGQTTRHVTLGLLAFSLALATGSAGIWWIYLRDLEAVSGAPVALSFVVLAVAFGATELVSVHLESRGEAHALTFSEIPFVLGLLLSAPDDLVLARVLSGFVVLALVRRQSLHKLAFNLSLFAAEIAVGAAVYRELLGSADPSLAGAWPAAFIALLAAQLVDFGSVTAAITIYSGWPGRRLVQQVFIFGTLSCLANTSTGLALAISIRDESFTGLLIVGVVVALFALYRAYLGLTERHKNLSTLHDFTRSLGGSDLDELERNVVLGASQILRAEHGAVLLPPVRDGAPASRVVSNRGVIEKVSSSPSELAEDLRILLPQGGPRLFHPGEPLPGWLGEIGVKDAVIVPLSSEGATVGALVVANRLTEVSTFVDDDLRLFETLANHANVALTNGRLVAALQHEAQEKAYQALHDPVTGLPNRLMLRERLERAIVTSRHAELGLALIFIDLGSFKEVTDTLGTVTGDRLLVEVRDRLTALLPDEAQLARFGGDQFAILVTGVTGPEMVLGIAEMVLAEFDTLFTSDEVSLVLSADLGIAMYPEHASTADLLIRRADAATYQARHQHSGIEVYAAESDPYAPRRLALAADLREALERNEVDVFVQPKLSLTDETVLGAEALVRWTHPRLGPLSPDQFIPAAEHTGVIRQLTTYVVRDALAQCRSWRDSGYDLTIAVNLSGRSLFDTHLVEDIGKAIEAAGVPASALTLELTESTVMSESHRALAVLEGLQTLGVRLSVDDFGTGYSSLAHLRSLPVTELKIDKSFVMAMTVSDQDAVIVRALVELGRRLGLTTVAEGVESRDAQVLLREYGCDAGQGYLFSRPVPADQFRLWLDRQRVRRLDQDGVVPFKREARRAVGLPEPT